jgi:FXSXX-COOH protein
MSAALATLPTDELTDPEATRTLLADLAALGAEELAAQVQRALPTAATGQVPVAAFQSSI